jgi:hypothetical protein
VPFVPGILLLLVNLTVPSCTIAAPDFQTDFRAAH